MVAALSHQMTAKSLGKIGETGGPRCCKRDSFLSILAAVDFVEEHFGVKMEKPPAAVWFHPMIGHSASSVHSIIDSFGLPKMTLPSALMALPT